MINKSKGSDFAAMLLTGSLFLGCGRPGHYEEPPVEVLREHPDYAAGRLFSFDGAPVRIGDYSVMTQHSNGFTSWKSEIKYYVYELDGGIVAVSEKELPETGCSGVRGSWGPAPHPDDAKSAILVLPSFVLHISQARWEEPTWR
jgi:hypothetical protein